MQAPVRSAAKDLDLKEVGSGGNVVLMRPRDSGVFYHATMLGGLKVTGLVQTYLDCMLSGGRGEEAAAAILEQKLWQK